MSITRHISHIKSSGGTAPSAGNILYGEIAVGYKKGSEALYIKNSNDEVVTFTNSASSQAMAELYTDQRVVTKVEGDSAVSATLSESGETSGRTITVSHATGSSQSGFKKLSTNAYGHVTAGTDVTLSDLVTVGALSGVSGEKGISVSTKESGSQTIGHENEITPGTSSGASGDKTITTANTAVAIPSISYDAQGHITSTTTTTVNLKVNAASTSTQGVVQLASTTGDSSSAVMTQKAVTDAINDSFTAQDAMRYKGALGTAAALEGLTNYKVGDSYKISAPFTSGTKTLEAGDMVIAAASGSTYSEGNFNFIQANLDPTTYVLKTQKVEGKNGLTGGGALNADIEISHVTAHTATGSTSTVAQTPNFGGTFTIPVVEYDTYGHVTATTTANVTIPQSGSTWTDNYYITAATVTTAASKTDVALNGNNAAAKASFTIPSATTTAAGVMAASDKNKLDAISSGATKVVLTNAKTAGDTTLATLTIDGTATTIKADNKALTVTAGSTTVTQYAPSEAKSIAISGDDAVTVTGASGTITITVGDIVCGDY